MAKSATRMELARLKARLSVAVRGYELLKDKADELSRQEIRQRDCVRSLERECRAALAVAEERFRLAQADAGRDRFLAAAAGNRNVLEAEVGTEKIMSVSVQKIEWNRELTIRISYLDSEIPREADEGAEILLRWFPELFKLAEAEERLAALERERAKTRRRVNALESVIIPGLEAEKRLVRMKLDENERETLSRLVKVFSEEE